MVDKYVYVSEYVGGLAIYDASESGGPVVKSLLYGGPHLRSRAYDLLLQSPYLYAANSTRDGAVLTVHDTNTATPTLVGEYLDWSQSGLAVQSAGNYVYFGMSANTAVLDVSHPTSPARVATIPVPALSFARAGSTLFAGTLSNNLVVMNITSPALPAIVRSITLPDLPLKLRVFNNLLFVADGSGGLFIFDISFPTSPVLVSRTTSFSAVNDVAVVGTTAFLAAGVDGLGVSDISNPAQPSVISKTPLARIDPFLFDNPLNEALSIAANDGIVYVGTLWDNGLVFGLDCANPRSPRIVSVYAYGTFILTWVGKLVFKGSDLFAAGYLNSSVYPIVHVDVSRPYNSINQYFPPLSLQAPIPLTAPRVTKGNARLGSPRWKTRRLRGNRFEQYERRGASRLPTPSADDDLRFWRNDR